MLAPEEEVEAVDSEGVAQSEAEEVPPEEEGEGETGGETEPETDQGGEEGAEESEVPEASDSEDES